MSRSNPVRHAVVLALAIFGLAGVALAGGGGTPNQTDTLSPIAAGGAPVRLEPDFREIHFGRWEGLTMEEIEAADPALAGEWKAKAEGFEYPGGELRATFRERVLRGLDRLDQSGASSVLAVVHKGVICTIAEHLADQTLEDGSPALGQAVSFTRSNGIWRIGRRGSDPEGLNDAA